MHDVAVVGAGIVGLTTALALAGAGHDVAVVSADASPDTVSAVAGGLWSPFKAGPPESVARWARTGYDRYAELARDTPAAGVRLVPSTVVVADDASPLWWEACAPVGAGRAARPDELPVGAGAARVVVVPIVDTTRHLAWLRDALAAAGVEQTTLRLSTVDAAFEHARAVVACPGLAARELFGDTELEAIRGVVVEVDAPPDGPRHPLLDDTGPHPTYVLPRTDGTVLLGGRADVGDERRSAAPEEVEEIVARCARLVPALAGARRRAVRVGLRPGRPVVRLEELPHAAGRLVVSYGHGGSGWTLAHGCADDVVALLARD